MHKLVRIIILNFLLMFLVACDNPQTQEHANLAIDKTLCQFSVGECYKKVADLQVGLLIDPVNTPSEKDNVYQGPLIFGSCSSDYMAWRVFVSFDYQQQPRTLMYDFLADNDNN